MLLKTEKGLKQKYEHFLLSSLMSKTIRKVKRKVKSCSKKSKSFNTYGGWGEEILGKLVEPFFNRLRAEERAATGGTEWSTLAKREFLFQCTSVAIARGNTMILNTLRQSWQQQPSANTKRGKLAAPRNTQGRTVG